ncbi:MAG TPA: c-type cytochrome [Terriglobales bacterium]|jgi:mono/diheme cytochrome c family protein|nr:c-type cytochrome [Terriglobales bacterium]
MTLTRLKWLFTGIVLAIVLFLLAVFISLRTWVDGFSALDRPGGFEAWIAGIAQDIAMPSEAKQRKNPVPESPQVLAEGREHFADHCATCHANNGSGNTEIGSHVYPRPPDLRKGDTQNMTDGELFYTIEKGIRWTAMPGWQGSHSDADNWKLVRFIRHLPQITEAEIQEMEKLNPKGPDEWKEQQREEQFLNGAPSAQTPKPQHHH